MKKLLVVLQVVWMLGTIGLGMIGMALFGWVWAIRVLAGKNKVGPRTMWNDQTARHDVGARRTELKVAGSLLACYLGIAIIVITTSVPTTYGSPFWWVEVVLGVLAFLTVASLSMPLGLIWREDWERVSQELKKRQFQPVLL